ncbi:LOW QUALITY PROTEIN: ATP-binding cassette sub-family C member 10-like, partial [Saccoglossus kowalevskii]
MTFWKDLCGVRNVSVWSENDFGQCFSDLAFIVASHILFAVCSSFQLGTHQVTYRQSVYNTNRTYFKIVIIRLVISIFLAALSAIEIIVLSLQKVHLEIIDYTTNAVVFIAWLLHAGALWKLRLLPVNRGRGPITLIVTWILTLFAICIQLRSAILNLTGELHNLQTVEIIVIIIVGCLQCLYLISLVPPFTAPIDLSLYSSINDTDGAREPLLASSGQQLLGIAEDNANCFSKLAFWWVNPLMLKGSKGCLNSTEDLFLLPRKLQTEYVSAMFVKAWKKPIIVSGEVEGSIQEVKNTSVSDESEGVFIPSVEFSHTDSKTKNTNMKSTTLLMGMHNMLGCRYYSLGLLKLFSDGLNFAGPLLLHALVSYMENRDEPVQNGYYYAGALFLTTSITALSSVHFNYLVNKVSLEMRVALVTSVYHKTLSVGTTALSKFATGEIVNLMSTDVDRVRNFAISFHAFWSLPFTVAIALFLLYLQVGLSFLVGVGVMVVLIPLNHCIARKIGKLNQSLMKKKDARVKMMSEVLFGIRVIKFFAWEKHFGDRIKSLRSDELQSLKGIKYLDAFCVYFWATTPVLISLLTFTTYAALGNTLTAAKVFTCVALFNMLVVPLNAFPWVLNGLMEAWVSMNRLQTFMDLQELNLCLYYEQGPSEEDIDTYVSIKKSSFHWEWHLTTTDEKSTGDVQVTGDSNSALSVDGRILKLTDINLEVRKGQLIGIIGRVGSGKSSLLSAITGEMNKDSGELWVDDLPGGFGLVTQESWIQHDTVKDNILFGEPFNVYKYDAVLDACALKEDMKILPAGDETEIGENGVTLSGGQKARISLARAVYQ